MVSNRIFEMGALVLFIVVVSIAVSLFNTIPSNNEIHFSFTPQNTAPNFTFNAIDETLVLNYSYADGENKGGLTFILNPQEMFPFSVKQINQSLNVADLIIELPTFKDGDYFAQTRITIDRTNSSNTLASNSISFSDYSNGVVSGNFSARVTKIFYLLKKPSCATKYPAKECSYSKTVDIPFTASFELVIPPEMQNKDTLKQAMINWEDYYGDTSRPLSSLPAFE